MKIEHKLSITKQVSANCSCVLHVKEKKKLLCLDIVYMVAPSSCLCAQWKKRKTVFSFSFWCALMCVLRSVYTNAQHRRTSTCAHTLPPGLVSSVKFRNVFFITVTRIHTGRSSSYCISLPTELVFLAIETSYFPTILNLKVNTSNFLLSSEHHGAVSF